MGFAAAKLAPIGVCISWLLVGFGALPAVADRQIGADGGFPGFTVERGPSERLPVSSQRLPRGTILRGESDPTALASDEAAQQGIENRGIENQGFETIVRDGAAETNSLPYGLPDPEIDLGAEPANPNSANPQPAAANAAAPDPVGFTLPSALGAPNLFEPGSFAPPTTWRPPRPSTQPAPQTEPPSVRNAAPAITSARSPAASPISPNPAYGTQPVQAAPLDRAVESSELDPIMASDGSGLPSELWLGLDMVDFDRLIANLDIPPRSTALFELWRRLMSSEGSQPSGTASADHFLAVRLEGLTRAGLFSDALRIGTAAGDTAETPMVQVLLARAALGAGDLDRSCEIMRPIGLSEADLPERLVGEVWATLALCAARHGSLADAGLIADMARDRDVKAPAMLKLIDTLAAGEAPEIDAESQIGLITWKLLSLDLKRAGAVSLRQLSAPALAATALDPAMAEPVRLAAAERAVRARLLSADILADLYRTSSIAAADPAAAERIAAVDAEGRAALFKAIEGASEPGQRARLIRRMLADARRDGLGTPIAAVLASALEGLRPGAGFDWFGETAVDINLAAGRYEAAMAWAIFSSPSRATGPSSASLLHWLNLVDIASPSELGQPGGLVPRGANLAALQELAQGGGFKPDTLHRLVSVLDALRYQIPIPLWEAASRTAQPTEGFLPETGILSQLQTAAGQRAHGRVILLAMAALGPDGAEGANLIALGDAIRALSTSGLEAEARQLAFEALYPAWARRATD